MNSSLSNTLVIASIILSLTAVGITGYTITKPTNIAFVESNVLLTEYSESKEAQEELNTKIEEWSANVTTLQNELEVLNNTLIEQAESWNTSEREAHLENMQLKQQELGRYSNAVNQQASKLESELMEPIYASINNRIKAFGEEEGYSIVFGTVQGGNILYGTEAVNVTWEFIRYLEGDE
ncbi:MAG: OmpH family outer membrane protein [bacterium]|nr:OmpH family outer membrane protein [bacterium]